MRARPLDDRQRNSLQLCSRKIEVQAFLVFEKWKINRGGSFRGEPMLCLDQSFCESC
jgi:hypothetical protein